MIPISKVKYALYGALISTSIVSTIAYAGTIDGVFGDYFRNIVTNAASCGTNTAIIGFDTTTGSTFGTQKCTTFQSIVQSVLGTSTAPLGQAMIGYNPDGSPKYGTIDKICIGTGGVYNMCDGVNALG